ncbi:spore germination protein PE [Thermolongibacillus altinsuensis]|jgi:spore germination protein PE|uniref:Spore germination protein PE n=1 Tax=Thermolongibacillus altinsuensis TaxID=575256 RepID=A0A4R1QHD1_9BACL|nr:spore germination protein GerPE [Thermolongibacillus altinsuensis]TCL51078.1 spore germination protein PE [Thermolongibacillus altinsuensis]GMB08850.1 putative spore germination protein GerPE [Thermolongibacillus altinsuensis]
MSRLSLVQWINTNAVAFGSVLQIGDSNQVILRSKAIALQRQYEFFDTRELPMTFPVFTKPIPKPNFDDEPMVFHKLNECPTISVRSIRTLGISSSSAVHIGSTKLVQTEVRIKHIRQLAEKGEKDASHRRAD